MMELREVGKILGKKKGKTVGKKGRELSNLVFEETKREQVWRFMFFSVGKVGLL